MLVRILFFKQHGALADRIRALDGGDYTHVALALPDGRILEAAPPRVRVVGLGVRAAESSEVLVKHLTVAKPTKIFYTLSKPYDWGWLENRVANPPDRFHCATLLGWLFGLMGPRHPDLSLSELMSFCEEG